MQRFVRVCSFVVLLTMLVSLIPVRPVGAVPQTPTFSPSSPSISPVPPPGYTPEDVKNGITPAAYAEQVANAIEGSHELGQVFDGTFSSGSRYIVSSYSGPYNLSSKGPSSQIISLPPGQYEALEVDLTVDISRNGSTFLAWSTDQVNWYSLHSIYENNQQFLFSQANLRIGLPNMPNDKPLFFRMSCGAALGTTLCTWANLRFYKQMSPLWRIIDMGQYARNDISLGVYDSVIEAQSINRTSSASLVSAPNGGAFFAIEGEAASSISPKIESAFPVKMPQLSRDDPRPFQISFRWSRRDINTNTGNPQELVFAFRATDGSGAIFTGFPIPSTGFSDWQTGTITLDNPQKNNISGKSGYIQIYLSDFDQQLFALDDVQFILDGQPLDFSQPFTVPPDLNNNCKCAGQNVFEGDPVNTYSGAYIEHQTDMVVATGGMPLAFERTYVSNLADKNLYPQTGLGIGWRHVFAETLTFSGTLGGEPNKIIYEVSDGNRWRFDDLGNNQYRAGVGVYATLTKTTTSYVVTLPSQERREFNLQGKLIKRYDTQGHSQTITFGTSGIETGQPVQVVDDQSGRKLVFGYQTAWGYPRLTTITNDLNQVVTLGYWGNMNDYDRSLTSVRQPNNSEIRYTYDISTPKRPLVTVRRWDGSAEIVTLQNTYTNGKVTNQVDVDGRQWIYVYNTDSQQRAITTMTVKQNSKVEDTFVYHYRKDGTIQWVERNGGFLSYSTFGNNLAPRMKVDANGVVTDLTTNAKGYPTSIRVAKVTPQGTLTRPVSLQTLVEYNTNHYPTKITDPRGVVTTYTYNADNNVTMMVTMGVTTTWTYTANKQVETMTAPNGVVTKYTYTPAGDVQLVEYGYGTAAVQKTFYTYDVLGRVTDVTMGYGTALAVTTHTDYRTDGQVWKVTQNYKSGQPITSVQNLTTEYGYDGLGRGIWTKSPDGRYHGYTKYDAANRVVWTLENPINPTTGAIELPTGTTPPAYSPTFPDGNVATFYGYDSLGRTVLVTQTGILNGSFNPATLTFSSSTIRVTRTEYDQLSRPITVTQNYRPDINGGQPSATYPDINVQTLTYYDGAGNVAWQRDSLNRWTFTGYDAISRPITTTLNYENGNPLTVSSGNTSWATLNDTDYTTVTRYDTLGRVQATIDNYVDGVVNINPNNGEPIITDMLTDHMTLTGYDQYSRVISSTINYTPVPNAYAGQGWNIPSGLTKYNTTTGQVAATQDVMGQWYVPNYDALGRIFYTVQNCRDLAGNPTSGPCVGFNPNVVVDRNIRTDESYFDALGRVYETKNVLGVYNHTNFDALGRVTETIQNYVAGGAVNNETNVKTTTQYLDVGGHAWSVSDPTNKVTTYQTNALGQTITMTDTANLVTRYGFDGSGTPRWSKTPDGVVSVTFIDGLGRPVRQVVNYQDGVEGSDSVYDLTTTSTYDKGGRQIAIKDSLGRTTQYDYDLRDRLIRVTENAINGCSGVDCNLITNYQYDRQGNRIKVIDARGLQTQHSTYDALNRLFTISFGGNIEGKLYQYNNRGQVTEIQSVYEGRFYEFFYDELGRLKTNWAKLSFEDEYQRYTYDALGRKTAFYDQSAALNGETGVISYTYNPLNRITLQASSLDSDASTTPIGIPFNYDAAGRSTQVGGTYYDYDSAGRPWKMRRNNTLLADYTYDSVGRLSFRQTYQNNAVVAKTTYNYDAINRVASLTSIGAGTVGGASITPLSSLTYTYDRAGQPLTFNETQRTSAGGTTTSNNSYTYDGVGRLKTMAQGGTTTTYAYDKAGNRTGIMVNGTLTASYTYNVDSQITNAGYSYDADGNLLTDGSKTYTYDNFNRLKTVAHNGTTYRYQYHGETLISTYTNNVLQTSRFYDTVTRSLPNLLRIRHAQASTPTNNTMLNDAITGLPLGHESNVNGTINNYVYLTDRVDTVKQVYDVSLAQSRPIQRDVWGVLTGAPNTSIGFTGEWTDTNTNLVFLHARWYNPSSGTFLGRDPFAGYPTQPYSFHPYQYGYSSPLRNTDHSGRECDAADSGGYTAMDCGGGGGSGGADTIGPIGDRGQDLTVYQPQPNLTWSQPIPQVNEGYAGPLPSTARIPEPPNVPSVAPQQSYNPGRAPRPVPPGPTQPLRGAVPMLQCGSDLDPYEQTQPQQAYPETKRDQRRDKRETDFIYRRGENKPQSVRLNRVGDWETGLSFSTTRPGQSIKYSVAKLRLAGFIVEFDGGIPTVNVRNGDPWIDPKTGKQHIPGPDHVRVYHPSLAYWDEWYYTELANKGQPIQSMHTVLFYDLREP